MNISGGNEVWDNEVIDDTPILQSASHTHVSNKPRPVQLIIIIMSQLMLSMYLICFINPNNCNIQATSKSPLAQLLCHPRMKV